MMIINMAVLISLLVLVIVLVTVIVVRNMKKAQQDTPRIVSFTIDAPDDIPVEEKERIVYQSLLKAGYSPAGSCGIMGNIAVESPDFDPSAVNEANGALGLFQWNDVGNRQQHFKEFCKENKLNWNSIESQLSFAVYELSGADPIACRLDEYLKETDDAYTAAVEFTAGFERCISDSGKAADVYTGSLYPEFYGEHYQALAKRINKAMNYYIRFSKNDNNDRQINITIEQDSP